jgi:DNA polymerase-4
VLRDATVLHADCDAFFAAVEQRDDPRLRGRPVCVGHGVVMAASYEARVHGIRGGMGGGRARRLCPDAVFVDPRFSAYVEASHAVFDVFERMAPVVEGLSLEEAFLDVSGLGHIKGSPFAIARRLRHEVRADVGLPITVGAARTKFLAKVASRTAKPNGVMIVAPEAELGFLRPLPIERIWGIGPASEEKLHAIGVRTVADAAALGEAKLIAVLGRAAGRHVHALVHNRDRRRVRRGPGRRSIGSQSALGRRRRSPEELDAVLVGVVDRVTRRMRKGGRSGRTVILRLRFADYARATRSFTFVHPTAGTATILVAARALLASATPLIERRGCTLIGLTITNLSHRGAGVQLPLPAVARTAALDAAMDEVRERYGPTALTRAVLLGRHSRNSPWDLPSDSEPP